MEGGLLLAHLADRLEPTTPHLPLTLHTPHALVAARPTVLDARPGPRASLAESLDRLVSTDSPPRSRRDQVAGLHYALRLSNH